MKHTFTYNHQSQFIEMFGKDKCPYIHLKDVCIRHGEYGSNTASIPFEEGLPRYIRITDLNYDGGLNENMVAPRDLDSKYLLAKGDFLFARTGATVGKTYCHKNGHALYAGYLIRYVTDKKILDPEFLASFTRTPIFWRWVQGQMKVGAQPNISSRQYDNLPVPVPSKNEQNSFLAIVRQADKSKFDGFKSQFIEMFGNPINNTKNWKISSLKDACVLVSDGPFGSNLKSCHYVQEGVRVIRLQNICQGQFNDTDRAYISNEHYKTLKRYTCNPGEIVIATLGEPNLRACIIPDYIKLSINKADCIHVIPKSDLLNPVFVCSYFNSTQVLHLATSDIHGTTRARIAGGQVANFPVFLPPIKLQEEFAAIVRQADKSKYYVQNKQNYICHILTNQIQLRRCS